MHTAPFEQVYKDYLNDQLEFKTDESFYEYLIGLANDGVIRNAIIYLEE